MEKNNLNEEFSQELSDLKWQFENMQQIFQNLENTISEAQESSESKENSQEASNSFEGQQFSEPSKKKEEFREDSNSANKPQKPNATERKSDMGTFKLSNQIQEFMKQTQTQQNNVQLELQKSIQQAIDILNQANVQIQTNQALIMMNQFINQAEQQINHLTQSSKSSEAQRSSQNQKKPGQNNQLH